MEEYPIARFYRDAKVLEIGEGTSEVQRLLIARGLGPAGRVVDHESSTVAREEIARGPGADAGAHRAGGRQAGRQGKLFVRDRIALLFDAGTFVEDGLLANALADGLPADGVVTGRGLVQGRPALVVANDPSVKAGSWGARTVEKIIRMTEVALRDELPIFWFIDSAGRPDHRPGRPVPGPPRRGPDLRTTRSRCPARCRRSAACSGRARPAAPTSRRSATW